MTRDVHLQLPDEYVEALRRHVAASGECVDTDVSQLIAEHLQPDVASVQPANTSSRDFGAWLRSWALRHPRLQHVVDDRRDSISADCGEWKCWLISGSLVHRFAYFGRIVDTAGHSLARLNSYCALNNDGGHMANPDPPINEQQLDLLESSFPAASGVAFSMAFQQAVAAGLDVLVSENGAIFQVSPDGSRQFVKEIPPPIPAEPGQKFSIR